MSTMPMSNNELSPFTFPQPTQVNTSTSYLDGILNAFLQYQWMDEASKIRQAEARQRSEQAMVPLPNDPNAAVWDPRTGQVYAPTGMASGLSEEQKRLFLIVGGIALLAIAVPLLVK